MQNNNTQMIHVAQPAQQVETVSPQLRMIEKAIDKGASFEVISKMYELYEKHEAAQAKKAFYAAMSVFQGCVQMAHKSASASFRTKNGGQMGYSFASLDDVIKVARPALQKSGLSYTFKVKQDASLVTVNCTISHGDGHSESCTLSSPLDASGQKNALQQIGSTISYLRRYTLCSALGIATSDDLDDGHMYDSGAQEAEVVAVDYHHELKKTLAAREQKAPGYKERVYTRLSGKLDRTVIVAEDLSYDEARDAYTILMSAG